MHHFPGSRLWYTLAHPTSRECYQDIGQCMNSMSNLALLDSRGLAVFDCSIFFGPLLDVTATFPLQNRPGMLYAS